MADSKQSFVTSLALQHGRRLKRFFAQRLANRADAPDLVQEVYLRLLRADQHEHIRNPEAYLLTIAGNLLYEHRMRQAAAPQVQDVSDIPHPFGVAEDDPAACAEVQQRLRALERALVRLPVKSQAVLLLSRRDGLSLPEVAARLGISPNTAKKHLVRALSRCRQQLDERKRK